MSFEVFIVGIYSDRPVAMLCRLLKIFNNLGYKLCVFVVMGSQASHFTSEF